MDESIHGRILRALFMALKPLAKALLRAGVGYREFADVAKAAFIDEASSEFGLRGRPTNVSRVAVMTGISRKEIKRIRDVSLQLYISSSVRESPASIVLSRWYADSRFCDPVGVPRILDYDGPGDTFTRLVNEFAGDVPPGALRMELKRVGAVEEIADKRLKALKRHFTPEGAGSLLVLSLNDIVAPSISTLAYNCNPELAGKGRYHQVVSIDDVPLHALPSIALEANSRLRQLAEQFDTFLINTCDSYANDSNQKSGIQAGIGLFYFERDLD